MAIAQITIRQLLQRIIDGEIRIPAFQRDFIWEPDRVQFLMDSIFKGYPIGTILFWRTKEQLSYDRDLGPFTLPGPKKEYPIDYVLDGQQRITSIFSTFQTDLKQNVESKVKWVDIFFDLNANSNAQDSQFVALDPSEVKSNHVPLRILFDVAQFGKFTRSIIDDNQLQIIDQLQAFFKEAIIPVETVETEDHSKIAIIFERINRGGVPLDTYQLLSAWTWSGDFDLRTKFDELATELDEVGFNELRDDPDLLLKCCAAVIRNDASIHAIVDLKGTEVRDAFSIFKNGLMGAIDFLRRDCGVVSLKVMPYKSMIIPLTRCFSTDKNAGFHPNAKQRAALLKWFWHSCFSRRYSNSVDSAISQDISLMQKLLINDTSEVDKRTFTVTDDYFLKNGFVLTSVNTKVFVLLLAIAKPKSFLSGADVDLNEVLVSCNRTEFHHIFPKNYLATHEDVSDRGQQFMLANCNYSAKINNKVLDTVFVAKKSKSMRPAERVLKSQSRPITSQFLPFISINLGCQRLKNHQPHNAARTTKIVF